MTKQQQDTTAADIQAAVDAPAQAPAIIVPNVDTDLVDSISVITVLDTRTDKGDTIIDAEVVEGPAPLPKAKAEALDKKLVAASTAVGNSLGKLADLVAEARIGQIHVALGFPSWTAYFADRVTAPLMAVGERKTVALMLHNEGMGNRGIGAVLGISHTQAGNDVKEAKAADPKAAATPASTKTTGKDGKNYTRATKPKAPAKPKAPTPPPAEPTVNEDRKTQIQIRIDIAFTDAENIVDDLTTLTGSLEKLYATAEYKRGDDKAIQAQLTQARKMLAALPKAPAKK